MSSEQALPLNCEARLNKYQNSDDKGEIPCYRQVSHRKTAPWYSPSFSYGSFPFSLVLSIYTYLCCIPCHKTMFRKQFAFQGIVMGVFDYEPVSQTIFRIFHTRPLYLLTLIPLVTKVWHISTMWYRQAVIVCSFEGKNKEKEKKSTTRKKIRQRS